MFMNSKENWTCQTPLFDGLAIDELSYATRMSSDCIRKILWHTSQVDDLSPSVHSEGKPLCDQIAVDSPLELVVFDDDPDLEGPFYQAIAPFRNWNRERSLSCSPPPRSSN